MDGDTIDGRLVDAGSGLIDRRIFSDKDIFEQEMKQVFGKSWLFGAGGGPVHRLS